MQTEQHYFDGRARLVDCPVHADSRGLLRALDFDHLPFVPRRIFTVGAAAAGCMRGGHAHKAGNQLLVCVRGRIDALMRCQGAEASVTLEPESPGLLFGSGVWCRQEYLTQDAVLLVLASEPYDPRSYVHEWT